MASLGQQQGSCARYIGRVGALAVALGVAGAAATTPGVAWAEDTAPSAPAASDGSSETSTGDNAPPSDPAPTEETGSTDDPADDTAVAADDETPGTADELATPSGTVTTHDGGVIVRTSGGAHTSGDDDTATDDAATDTRETDARKADSDAKPPDATPVVTEAEVDTAPQRQSAEVDETAQLLAATEEPVVAHHTVPIPVPAVAPPKLPTPAQVVSQIKKTVTTCVCQIINTAVDLIGSVLGGGGTAGPAGPAAPAESPVMLAMLAWARREINRAIDVFSRTPIARFAHSITTQITQAITDFGNSPFGREISTRIVQFLEDCRGTTSLPAELERVTMVSGLTEPTDFAILTEQDDAERIHRIFITEKSGTIKVYDPHEESVTVLLQLQTVTADGERGLVGIEVDPQFWTEGAEGFRTIYVAYTNAENFDTLSRLEVSTTFDAAVEQQLLVSTEPGNNFHHGGELLFDPAGQHLYWAVGDNTDSANAQDLTNIHGKILRLNRDGNAPGDNPYVGVDGAVEQIYAIGLRNPYRLAFTPNGKLLVGDVGEANWEELNVVTPGANYGWPAEEGDCGACEYVNPIYAYRHSAPPANAGSITSVVVYSGGTFGAEYQNKVFIADYSIGWIKELTFDSEFTSLISERMFDSQAGTTVKLDQGPDGNLYQLNIYPGQLSVIRPSGGNRAPNAVITSSTPWGAGDSLDVAFLSGSSTDPEGQNLQYQWNFGNGQTSTAANPTMTFVNTGDGHTAYTVTLTVSDGEKTDTATQRIVIGSTPPTASIDPMVDKYDAGDTITFSGQGADTDDGVLPATAYRWSVVFHHADHVHPFRDNIVGPSGSVTIPRTRDQLGNTFYRISLTVTDNSGLSTTAYKDVKPNVVRLEVNASDPDATITIDGVRYQGSYVEEEAVVGVLRVINAPSPQRDGELVFVGWSDGGTQSHTITTPEADAVITATFEMVPSTVAALT